MTRSCIFCGRSPTTEEHIISRWLRPMLQQHEASTRINRWTLTGNRLQVREEGWYARRAIEVTVKVVCGDCNENWMNDIERAARPFITKMVQNRVCLLTRDAQRAVATWCVLKAGLFQYRRGRVKGARPVMRPALAEKLFTTREPPAEDIYVTLARRAKPVDPNIGSFSIEAHSVGATTDKEVAVEGNITTFALDYMIFQVFDAPGFGPVSDSSAGRATLPIWPPSAVVIWPPPKAIAAEEIRNFAGRVRSPGDPPRPHQTTPPPQGP